MVNEKIAEIGEPEINVDELMARIRQAVAQREAEGRTSFINASAELFDLLSTDAPTSRSPLEHAELHPLRFQPEFVPRPDNHYHASDLLKYHDKQFVWNAYRALLKRVPDNEGFERYLKRLRDGRRRYGRSLVDPRGAGRCQLVPVEIQVSGERDEDHPEDEEDDLVAEAPPAARLLLLHRTGPLPRTGLAAHAAIFAVLVVVSLRTFKPRFRIESTAGSSCPGVPCIGANSQGRSFCDPPMS